jgi:phasin family protein
VALAPRRDAPSKEKNPMATTTETAGEKINGAAEGIESAMKTGAETLKAGFEKAVKNYDKLVGFGKENVEAYVKSANVAGKGVETLHNELFGYSKQSIEGSIAATKALMGAKSVHEAFELQADYAKTAFDAYIGEITKISELFVSTSKEAFEPIQGRYQAWVATVQNARAA